MLKRLFFILPYIVLCWSCTPSQEAVQTLQEADSLFAEGELYTDTVKLKKVITSCNRFSTKEELARAYYYLGRNYSVQGMDYQAVDCYIAADRLQPKDNQLRGRLNYNMAYVCSMQQKDSLAILLYKKAGDYLLAATDTAGYAYALLDISYAYANLMKFEQADSLWQQVLLSSDSIKKEVDAYIWLVRAFFYCKQENGKEALRCLQLSDISVYSDYLYSQYLYTLAYFYNHQFEQSTISATHVIQNSAKTGWLMGTYAILQKISFEQQNAIEAAHYEQICDSLQLQLEKRNEECIRAITKIENYLQNSVDYKFLYYNSIYLYTVIGVILALLLGVLSIILLQKRKHNTRQQQIIYQQQIKSLNERNRQLINTIHWLERGNFQIILNWNDEKKMRQAVNEYFFYLTDKLLQINSQITHRDLQFCILILLDYKLDYCATVLEMSSGSMKTYKQRLAQKLGTTSKHLHTLLLKLASKEWQN